MQIWGRNLKNTISLINLVIKQYKNKEKKIKFKKEESYIYVSKNMRKVKGEASKKSHI